MHIDSASRTRALGQQFVRFGLSGVTNTLIYVASGWSLLKLGVGAATTGAVALVLATLTGFALHRAISFRSRNAGAGDLGRFLILGGFNTAVSSIGLPALLHRVGLPPTAALMVLSAILPITNFLAMRFWVFRHRGPA